MRVALGTCAFGLIAVAHGAAVPERTVPKPQQAALEAIANLEARGKIDPIEATFDRTAVRRAVRLIDRLPRDRGAPIASALVQVSAIAARLTAPRALALFGQLTVNDDWFARHGPPAAQTDVTDDDGVVYRYFPGSAFEFHPLANFAALNGAATSKHSAATRKLASALIARGVPETGGAVVWEYYFDYAGGQAPWLSGFSQAVAAQAFARAAALLPAEAPQLLAEANAAYRAIPGRLDQHLSLGPWIKLYSFNHDVVLNAQLQTVISLASYAAASSNRQAASLSKSLRDAAAKALPLFEAGAWSYYALPNDLSPLDYQEYVVELLQTLAKSDPRFSSAASRFASYQTQPPRFELANAGPGAVEFWVSKPSSVRVSALGGVQQLSVAGGWHVVSWDPGHAGVFPVRLEATDWAGNSTSAEALPIVRVAPPPKRARRARTPQAVVVHDTSDLPPLVVGAGLDTPEEAALAQNDGFEAVRMTLVWPAGASTPDPGAIEALDRLPAGTNLVLELDASSLPPDAPGRAALASYAAAVASQVPALHDLILGPAPTAGTASAYEIALAAVYDAVKQAAPTVRVDAEIAGTQTPGNALAAVATAYRASGRTEPLMDELAFQPAPAAGLHLWTLASLSQLITAFNAGFADTAQAGAPLRVIIDDMAFSSAIPQQKIALYPSASAGAGLDENSQAAAYTAALGSVSCQPSVDELLLDQLVDNGTLGGQAGLYYLDGSPKTSLQPVLQAVEAAQGSSRGCAPASSGSNSAGGSTSLPTSTEPNTSPPTPAPAPSPSPAPTPAPTPPPTPAPSPHSTKPSVALATPGALVFPDSISTTTPPSVHLGCTAACLYLITLQRSSDGVPVLATRGALSGGSYATVKLPHVRIPSGSYHFSVWLVAQVNPERVSVERSPTVPAN